MSLGEEGILGSEMMELRRGWRSLRGGRGRLGGLMWCGDQAGTSALRRGRRGVRRLALPPLALWHPPDTDLRSATRQNTGCPVRFEFQIN